MAERGTVMGDLRCGLRHRLGDNALVGRGRRLVGRLRGAGGRVGLLDLRGACGRFLAARRGGGEGCAAEGDAGDGRDHQLLNCVLVHVAPSLSVFRCAPLRRH